MAMVDRMNVDLLDESDLKAYDDLVADSVEGTIFHTSWWQNITDKAYGSSLSTERYGCMEDDVLVAAIPVPIYHKLGLSLVFPGKLTPYSGPIFQKKSNTKIVTRNSWKKSLNSEFAKIIKGKGLCVGYPFGPAHNDLQPFMWEGFSIGVSFHYVLDIDDLSNVQANFDRRARKSLSQALKSGLEIKYGNLRDFIDLNNETMKRQNHAIYSPELLENIYRESNSRGCGEVITAHDDNGPLGAVFIVWDKKRSYGMASGNAENSKNANTLLLWEVFHITKQKLNLDQHDFLGSTVPPIEYFLRQFGGRIHPHFFAYEKSLRRELLMTIRSRLFSTLLQ